jgi:DNA (cytosine-5)-methyltransferase 1/tRNA (cytosine38-C5)-methyltransferase
MTAPLKVLELFCGIGGAAAALAPAAARVVGAIDLNHLALEAYRANFPHPVRTANLESLEPQELAAFEADLWWMSPPCQPFTGRGRRRDDEDPRSRPLLHLVEAFETVRPAHVALENVPGFQASRTRQRLVDALGRQGYQLRETLLCPTRLGLPNRRLRYYLLASREPLAEIAEETLPLRPLAEFLDPDADSDQLRVEPTLSRRYRSALHRVDAEDAGAVTACFTAAYGHSPVRSGSYLQWKEELRYFSPDEILRLLGFPSSFRWPSSLTQQQRWRLAGNSLSVPAVRQILTGIPALAGLERAGVNA